MATKKSLPIPSISHGLLRELYQAAARFQQLAPWRWMNGDHVFGINNGNGVRLITVLGNAGEVFGLASYRGSAAANFLMRLRGGAFAPEDSEIRFSQDAILVDFIPRKELPKEDRAIIQHLDYKPPTGSPKLFPVFRSHKPGYVPWFIDEDEARVTLEDLQLTVRFAELLQFDPSLYDLRQKSELPFFPTPFSGALASNQFEWHNIMPVLPAADPPINMEKFDLPKLIHFRQPPHSAWELAVFHSLMPVVESSRPFFPKTALAAEVKTGYIIGHFLAPLDYTMAQTAARGIVEWMTKYQYRPAVIRVAALSLGKMLEPLAAALGIKLLRVDSLPMVNEARQSLEAFSKQF